MPYDIYFEVYRRLGVDLSKPIEPSQRALRILNHYQTKYTTGHSDFHSLVDRALHDLAGRNGTDTRREIDSLCLFANRA